MNLKKIDSQLQSLQNQQVASQYQIETIDLNLYFAVLNNIGVKFFFDFGRKMKSLSIQGYVGQ